MSDARLACVALMFGGFGFCLGTIAAEFFPDLAYLMGSVFLLIGMIWCGWLNQKEAPKCPMQSACQGPNGRRLPSSTSPTARHIR